MAFFYDYSTTQTTNSVANTENQAARLLTVAEQTPCEIWALYLACRMTSAGGAMMRLYTMGTAATVGSSATPNKRHPNSPAASTTLFTAPTAGSTPSTRVIVGCAATGGLGGWVASDEDNTVILLPNGGANGNASLTNLSALASTVTDWLLEFAEG